MAVAHFRGKTSPVGWGYLHGAFVVGGLVMLLLVLTGLEESGSG